MAKRGKAKDWRKPRKTAHLETKEKAYYIFCEGEKTEPLYFRGFKRKIEEKPVYKDMIHIIPCGKETLRVVKEAEEYIKSNGITKGDVWCIYDKDDFPDKDFNDAAERINQLNMHSNGVRYFAGWSNECIELWFVLHFAYYDSANHREYYISFLNDKLKKEGIKYTKSMKELFDVLEEYGEPKQAIRNAKKLLEEKGDVTPSKQVPATHVHELVEELAKYMSEESRHKYM